MNLTLVFSRKYRWPVHYFSMWCLGNSQKLLTTNQFFVSTILFTNINIPLLFQSAFWSLFNHHQKSQPNQEQCSLCCSSPCLCVLLCTYYEPLQCFSTYFCKLKEMRVLRHIFPEYVISCDYVSMDVCPYKKINFMLQLFHEILDFQKSCNLIDKEDL